MKYIPYIAMLTFALVSHSCKKDGPSLSPPHALEWQRASEPVLRDSIFNENYQVASDAHVFYNDGALHMIYTGDENGKPAIKIANGSALNSWTLGSTLLGEVGPSGLDAHKETGFYRKSANGKHQLYYIGYEDEASYEAQIFLAQADSLNGPYTQMSQPIIQKGSIANKEVYCMTSPSVVEHEGILYMAFIGWDNSPNNVTEVWVIGATSLDDGLSWTDFQLVDTRIGMEGQITKVAENEFIAVRTGEYQDKEAIFYSSASHPFGPWTEVASPILVQAGPPYEKDEIIAPQLFVDPSDSEQTLFYTGADYAIGWWIMMANKR